MNSSNFYNEIFKLLIAYHDQSGLILKSRTYTLANTIHIVIREPSKFFKKMTKLVFRNPRKLARILLGKYSIRSWDRYQLKLNKEYAAWVKEVESKEFNRNVQIRQVRLLKAKPLVSLITPVFNPPKDVHKKLVDSVLAQTYKEFELLLYDFGDDPEIAKLIDDIAKKDSRIRIKHGLQNKGISQNSNLCLQDAKGEFIGLLDHDDMLMPNALFECVKAINDTGADFVYTDKDKITVDDNRFEPLFKPDWSHEMALCCNYMTHFNLMRTKLVRELGGWDPNTDGAQDWDLFFRIAEKTNKIAHVPKILYHWRTVQSSTSNGIETKPYVIAGQINAVSKHLNYLNLSAIPKHDENGQMYIHWPHVHSSKLFVLHDICGDYNSTIRLIKTLKRQSDFDGSTILVAYPRGAIKNKDASKLRVAGGKLIDYNVGNFVNTVLEAVSSYNIEQVFYINTSVILQKSKDWISQLCGWLTIPDVRIASGALYTVDGRLADMGSFFNSTTRQFHKYNFGTGFRSGYNGYIQWARNLILVAEHAFIFDRALLIEMGQELDVGAIRDDELAKALSVINFKNQGRAVYDPLVSLYDRAPLEIRLPSSDELSIYIDKLFIKGMVDPYYNINLNNDYSDPRPQNQNQLKVNDYSVKLV